MPYREAAIPARPVARRCPSCRLINPPSALRCDCGYVFATGEQSAPLDLPRRRQQARARASEAEALVGIGLIALSVILCAVTINHGGYLWTGGIAVGLGMIVRSARGR